MKERIHAIDAARGLCLLNIFANHITLGLLPELSPSKIAFCDSAEIFVLLAGVSAFLACGPRGGGGHWDAATAAQRMWRRALTLYVANLAVIAGSLLVFVVGGAGASPPNPAVTPPGVPLIGDIELFCRERRLHAPDAPFIAITGTNGKSTTTALISPRGITWSSRFVASDTAVNSVAVAMRS